MYDTSTVMHKNNLYYFKRHYIDQNPNVLSESNFTQEISLPPIDKDSRAALFSESPKDSNFPRVHYQNGTDIKTPMSRNEKINLYRF